MPDSSLENARAVPWGKRTSGPDTSGPPVIRESLEAPGNGKLQHPTTHDDQDAPIVRPDKTWAERLPVSVFIAAGLTIAALPLLPAATGGTFGGVPTWACAALFATWVVVGGVILGATRKRLHDHLRAELDFQEREKFLLMVADNLPVMINYSDAEKRVRFINRLGTEWLACPREELFGRPLYEKLKVLNFQRMQQHVDAVLAGEHQSIETKIVFPDGERRTVAISFIPHRNGAGEVIGYFGVTRDVTRSRDIRQQLNQSQKMEAIGHLTGGIAHDFNNLLMVIEGYNQRALDHANDPDSVRPALTEVAGATRRAAELTKQLLAFSRRQVMEKRIFRASKAIDGIRELLERSAGGRHTIIIDDASDNACIETDGGEFSQAIVNLVINARDAMPRGGRILIALKIVDLGTEFTAIRKNMAPGRYVEISVADSGSGIDEETLEHIFEPFFTTKDQGKGTGLGLSMVYGLMQQSSGTVEVDSTIGAGTTFSMFFPLAEGDPEEMVADIDGDFHGNGETILLIEDDTALLELVRSMLESLGYNVLPANDGPEALEIEADFEGDIDLILSDVVMPVLGGFEVVEMIRESRPGTKAIFMSGYTNRASASGTDLPEDTVFLQKPVNPKRMAQLIHQEIHSHAATPA